MAEIGVFNNWAEGDGGDREGEAAGDSNAAVAFLFCARLGEIPRREVFSEGLSNVVNVLDL